MVYNYAGQQGLKVQHADPPDAKAVQRITGLLIVLIRQITWIVRVNAYASGATSISFIFDKIELTLEVMLRLNAFNESVHWFKAYVNENGFLTLKHPIIDAVIESNVVDALEHLFKIIVEDETKKHLRPLTELTYPEADESQPSPTAS